MLPALYLSELLLASETHFLVFCGCWVSNHRCCEFKNAILLTENINQQDKDKETKKSEKAFLENNDKHIITVNIGLLNSRVMYFILEITLLYKQIDFKSERPGKQEYTRSVWQL